jgi:hypothetical protein
MRLHRIVFVSVFSILRLITALRALSGPSVSFPHHTAVHLRTPRVAAHAAPLRRSALAAAGALPLVLFAGAWPLLVVWLVVCRPALCALSRCPGGAANGGVPLFGRDIRACIVFGYAWLFPKSKMSVRLASTRACAHHPHTSLSRLRAVSGPFRGASIPIPLRPAALLPILIFTLLRLTTLSTDLQAMVYGGPAHELSRTLYAAGPAPTLPPAPARAAPSLRIDTPPPSTAPSGLRRPRSQHQKCQSSPQLAPAHTTHTPP